MRRSLWLLVLSAILLALAPGCSSISMKMPANRFDSPECRGGPLKVHAEPVFQDSSKLTLVDNYAIAPAHVDSPHFEHSTWDFMISAGAGLLDRLDLELKSPSDSPTQLGLKYQLLGDPNTTAKAGNLSVAFTLYGGYGYDSGSDSSYDIFSGSTSATTGYNLKQWMYDLAVIGGYRVHDQILLYTGPFYQRYILAGDINQPQGSGNFLHFGGHGSQLGWSVGGQVDFNQVYFGADLSWSHSDFESASMNSFNLGGLVGVRL